LHPRLIPAALLVAGVALGAVTLTAASAAPGPAPGPRPAAPAGPGPVFLVNGGLAAPAPSGSPSTFCLIVDNTEAVPQTGGPVQSLRAGGKNYLVPVMAVPYLGRALDPGLFDPAAAARAEAGGRLPVRLSYTGHAPRLPGVTITRAGAGTADGYLTQAGAAAFGKALARQFRADHARGSYGQDGLFAGGVTVRLPGTPAPPASPKRLPMHTVTVTATNLAGKPDTGDWVWLINADDANRFDDILGASFGTFDHGAAKFSAPAGHYWMVGQFPTLHGGASMDLHIVPRTQVTVGSHTTLHLDARSAASQITMVTPRPAAVKTTDLDLVRSSTAGQAIGLEWFLQTLPGTAANGRIFVSPDSHRPSAGSLAAIVSEHLNSPAGTHGVPYQYWLSYVTNGSVPPGRRVVAAASLATIDARYYSARAQSLPQGYDPVAPASAHTCGQAGDIDFTIHMPSHRIVYLSGGATRWLGSGGQQADSGRSVRAGQKLADNWGAYPLHPAPNVRVPGTVGSAVASAARSGDTLGLNLWAFSDNQPGHRGAFGPGTGSYRISQNGTGVAGGKLKNFFGLFSAGAKLAPGPSVMTLTLNLTGSAQDFPLSGTSHTTWTWRSARPGAGELHPGWTCPAPLTGRSCAVEPLMTLRYAVNRLALDGSAPAGAQAVAVTAGHLQLVTAAEVTGAQVSVSFDGGKTWHQAKVTGSDGSYQASFRAPAGAMVTLRTHATDAAGGSITETVVNAYRTSS
jgi:hypothetical protein